jgi:hypothetical protein
MIVKKMLLQSRKRWALCKSIDDSQKRHRAYIACVDNRSREGDDTRKMNLKFRGEDASRTAGIVKLAVEAFDGPVAL